MSVRAGIVVTGTEILSGRVVDRNGPWVSERLAHLGVEVAHLGVVGDRRGDLEATLAFQAGEGLDLIVTTGGLGPTADDITAEVVAAFARRPMEVDTALEERITSIIAAYARRMRFDTEGLREGTRKQALVPRGAEALDPVGTAPGLVVPADETVFVVLPGPPRELQGMWDAAMASPAVARMLARAPDRRAAAMKMFGVPESTLAKSLREIGSEHPLERLEITTCLRRGAELEIDVTHAAADAGVAEALFAGLRERHGPYIYSEGGETIDEIVARALEGSTLAVAESCTAGLLAARLTERPGSSAWFAGGVIAYSNGAKEELLGVDGKLIEERGAVSSEVAQAMAQGAISRFGADVGIGITGVAGPGGGTEQKPVGYVCICVATADGRALARDPTLPGSRADVRDRSVSVALHMLRVLLSGAETPL